MYARSRVARAALLAVALVVALAACESALAGPLCRHEERVARRATAIVNRLESAPRKQAATEHPAVVSEAPAKRRVSALAVVGSVGLGAAVGAGVTAARRTLLPQ